tara:strand:+ start:51695 stop:52237 length:543 start_codon:yes stop_codon:yes gene_type:complete
MSDEKKKVADKASEIARNIWLAGVGAYGKAVEDAQDRLEKAGVEPPKLFRELVKAGTALEDEAREALEATSATRSSVEERISRVRENFHMQRPARIEDLNALHKKVDQLSRKVNKLNKVVAQMGQPDTTDNPVKRGAAKQSVPAKAKTKAKATTRPRAQAKAKTKPRTTTARRKSPAKKS